METGFILFEWKRGSLSWHYHAKCPPSYLPWWKDPLLDSDLTCSGLSYGPEILSSWQANLRHQNGFMWVLCTFSEFRSLFLSFLALPFLSLSYTTSILVLQSERRRKEDEGKEKEQIKPFRKEQHIKLMSFRKRRQGENWREKGLRLRMRAQWMTRQQTERGFGRRTQYIPFFPWEKISPYNNLFPFPTTSRVLEFCYSTNFPFLPFLFSLLRISSFRMSSYERHSNNPFIYPFTIVIAHFFLPSYLLSFSFLFLFLFLLLLLLSYSLVIRRRFSCCYFGTSCQFFLLPMEKAFS